MISYLSCSNHVVSSLRTCPGRGRCSWHISGCRWHKQVLTLTLTVRNSSGNSCACPRSCAGGRAPEERGSCLKPVSSDPTLASLENTAQQSRSGFDSRLMFSGSGVWESSTKKAAECILTFELAALHFYRFWSDFKLRNRSGEKMTNQR